jgi:predicted GNAT family acetyltransferase
VAGVTDNAERNRFELKLEDRVAGWVDYRREDGDVVALLHAEVHPDLRSQGIGERLVAGTFEELRDQGLRVRPVCPFVVAYVRRHPEVADLVA